MPAFAKKISCFVFFPLLLLLCASAPVKPPPSELSKEDLIKLYKEAYAGSAIDSIAWNGSVDKCHAGTLSEDILLKAEKRINFFRLVNGLDKITLKKDFNTKAQAAAFLVLANNKLSHHPGKDSKCYSADAAAGCSNSNLGFSNCKDFPETAFISGFIQDHGHDNYACGHRKWILYSKAKEMGYGATNKTEALYVTGIDAHAKVNNKFIAYPWQGYVPVNLIFPKWSLSIPEQHKVDFHHCKLIVTDELGKKLQSRILQQEKNVLDHTLVWEMPDLFNADESEKMQNNLKKKGFVGKTITVTLSNVLVDSEAKNFYYQVRIIDTPN